MSSIDEKTQKLGEVMVKIRDAFQGFQAAAASIDEFLAFLGKSMEPQSYNVTKIKWTPAVGEKGDYERSDDADSADFKGLAKDLADHKGVLQHEGFFYWSFKGNNIIGRKPAWKK
jgi:hypothetical protein